MNSMPLVSVIIPAYNTERTIQETIYSVLNQTYSNFELIIVNDASTDQTLELVKEIKDDRIRIFSFENAGLPASRNRGISLAKGEFITFLDADDLWTSDKLDAQIAALRKHPDAGAAYSWTAFVDESGKFLHAMEPVYFEGNVYKELLVSCFVMSGSNVLMRSQCAKSIGLFDPKLESAADWDYWIRLSRKWPFTLVPRYQILYRIWLGAMSFDAKTTEENTLKVIEKAFMDAPYELQSVRRKTLSIANQYFTSLYLTRNPVPNWKNLAFSRLKASVGHYPKILFSINNQMHLWTLMLLYLIPDKLSPKVVRFFLRMKGSFMMLTIPELRNGNRVFNINEGRIIRKVKSDKSS